MRQFDSDRRLMSLFCDTHCHISMMSECGIDLRTLFADAQERFSFFIDVGVLSNDLSARQNLILPFSQQFSVPTFFSAGVFPSADAILNFKAEFENFQAEIDEKNICAVGECGIDRHHNEKNKNERELFAMQLDFAAEKNLPVIVHSRDAFQETIDTIRASSARKGVIHCFSYGIDEARKFLDAGFFISLSGKITYGGKARQEQMKDLVKFIPNDMLLLETDAPYLAPSQHRGQTNTPIFIEEIFNFVADAKAISLSALQIQIEKNARRLFSLGQ